MLKDDSVPVSERERGNATAEFTMVSTLVILFFLLVLQIAFALYTKNMVTDAASAGARYGTLQGGSLASAEARTRQLLDTSLPFGYPASISSTTSSVNGVETLEVYVSGPLPLVGPFGISESLSATGRAVIQE